MTNPKKIKDIQGTLQLFFAFDKLKVNSFLFARA